MSVWRGRRPILRWDMPGRNYGSRPTKLAQPVYQLMHRGIVTRFAFVFLLAMSIVTVAARAQQPNPGQDDLASEPTEGLMAGDVVEAHFLDFPEAASLRLTISSAGTIFVPYAGQVKVAGMLPQEAEQAMSDALKAK